MKRHPRLFLWLVVFAAVIAVYHPVQHGEFVFDDDKLVAENEALWSALDWGDLARSFAFWSDRSDEPVRVNFRPVRFLSYKLDVWLTKTFRDGREPFFFHWHNIVLHALNGVLVGLLIRALWPRAALHVAPLAALIFVLHPVHTESVAYISGRRDVLFLTLYLLALLVYFRGRDGAASPRRIGLTAAACTLLYGAALLTKEMAITLPVTLWVCEELRRGAGERRPRIAWLTCGALAVTGVTFTVLLLSSAANPGGGAELWGGNRLNATWSGLRAAVFYARLLLWPQPLTIDYSFDAFPASRGLFDPMSGCLAMLAVIGVAVAAVVAWRRGNRLFGAGVFLFFVTLSPVLQLVPHPERVAERFAYLPSLAFLMALAGFLPRSVERARVAAGVAVALVLLSFAFLDRTRLRDWRQPYALWGSAARVNPQCARAHVGHGLAAFRLDYLDEAQLAFSRAIEILGDAELDELSRGYLLTATRNRALVLATSLAPADLGRARDDLEWLLERNDTDGSPLGRNPQVLFELMKVRVRLEEHDAATATARRLLALGGTGVEVLEASLYVAGRSFQAGDDDAGWKILEEAERRAVRDSHRGRIAYQKAEIHRQKESWKEALLEYQVAVRLTRGQRNWVSARYREGECQLRLGEVGIARAINRELAERVPPYWLAVMSRADLALVAGDLEEAQDAYEKLLAHDPTNEKAKLGLANVRMKQSLANPKETADTIDPTQAIAMLRLSKKLLAEERLDDAITALREGDRHAEGPAQRSNRLEIRWTIARLLTEKESYDDAVTAYESYLAIADLTERSEAVRELAVVLRKLQRDGDTYELLAREHAAGLRQPRMEKIIGDLAVSLSRRADAARWYRLHLEKDDVPEDERTLLENMIEILEDDP